MIKSKLKNIKGSLFKGKYLLLSVLVLSLVVFGGLGLVRSAGTNEIDGICVGSNSEICRANDGSSACNPIPGCYNIYKMLGGDPSYDGCRGHLDCSALSAVPDRCGQGDFSSCRYIPKEQIQGICTGGIISCYDLNEKYPYLDLQSTAGCWYDGFNENWKGNVLCSAYTNNFNDCVSRDCTWLTNDKYSGICTGMRKCSDFNKVKCDNVKNQGWGCDWIDDDAGCQGAFVGCSYFINNENQCKNIGCTWKEISTPPPQEYTVSGDLKWSVKSLRLKVEESADSYLCPTSTKDTKVFCDEKWARDKIMIDSSVPDSSDFVEWTCDCSDFSNPKSPVTFGGLTDITLTSDNKYLLNFPEGTRGRYYIYKFSTWVKVEKPNVPVKWASDDGSSIWIYDKDERLISSKSCNIITGKDNNGKKCPLEGNSYYRYYKNNNGEYNFNLIFPSLGYYRIDIYLYNHKGSEHNILELAPGSLKNYFSLIQKDKPEIPEEVEAQVTASSICSNLESIQPLVRAGIQATTCNPDSDQGGDYCRELGYGYASGLTSNRCCGNMQSDCGYTKVSGPTEYLCDFNEKKWEYASGDNKGSIKQSSCNGVFTSYLATGVNWLRCNQNSWKAGDKTSVIISGTDYDYRCTGTDAKFGAQQSNVGQTWAKCCGSDTQCSGSAGITPNSGDYGLKTGEYITTGGETWFCTASKTFVEGSNLVRKKGLLDNVEGFCESSDQCVLSETNNQCVPSGSPARKEGTTYICEDGEWTSSTKQVAAQLIELGRNDGDYAVYCDTPEKVLIKPTQGKSSDITQDLVKIGANDQKVCVLKTPSKVVYGIALGNLRQVNQDSFQKIFGSKCDNMRPTDSMRPADEDKFVQCNSNPKIFFNPKFHIVLVSNGNIDSILNKPAEKWAELNSPLDNAVINFNKINSNKPIKKYEKLFFAKKGNTKAAGVLEEVGSENTLVIQYSPDSLNQEICDKIKLPYNCNLLVTSSSPGAHFIVSQGSDLGNIWQSLTTKLIRIEDS